MTRDLREALLAAHDDVLVRFVMVDDEPVFVLMGRIVSRVSPRHERGTTVELQGAGRIVLRRMKRGLRTAPSIPAVSTLSAVSPTLDPELARNGWTVKARAVAGRLDAAFHQRHIMRLRANLLAAGVGQGVS